MTLRHALCVGVIVLAGCPSDDASGDGTDTDTESSTGATSPSTSSPSMSTSSTTSSSSSASTTDDTTGDATTSDTSTGEDSTTGEMLPGTCLGFDFIGTLGEVSSLDGMKIDSTCSTEVAACGGDVVGTWTIQSSCGWEDQPNFFSDCAGSTMTVTAGSITGTRTFNEDMTFALDLVTNLEFDANLDTMTCYMADCATFEAAAIAQGIEADCMDAGDGTCDCAMTVVGTNMSTGTWATAGNAITLTTKDAESTLEYCVADGRLDLWTPIAQPTVYEEPCGDDQDCLDALGNLSELYVCVIP
jgi:hypothetical protein